VLGGRLAAGGDGDSNAHEHNEMESGDEFFYTARGYSALMKDN
jgi:hypothetical protein